LFLSEITTRSLVASTMSESRSVSRCAASRSVMSSSVPTCPVSCPSSSNNGSVADMTQRTMPSGRTTRTIPRNGLPCAPVDAH